jgi:hypothetical protein
MKIRSVGAELFHAVGRKNSQGTGRHSHFVVFGTNLKIVTTGITNSVELLFFTFKQRRRA